MKKIASYNLEVEVIKILDLLHYKLRIPRGKIIEFLVINFWNVLRNERQDKQK